METLVLSADDPASLQQALEVLRRGEAVAFPTDTVYGIGVLLRDDETISQLYRIKSRDQLKAIPVLLADMAQLSSVAESVGELANRLATAFWPGPLTLVVPRRADLPRLISPTDTVGVRVPNHPVALALLRAGGPMAVTSANLSGQESCCTAGEVLAQLAGRFSLLLDGGRTPGNLPSTVVDCRGTQPLILRQGPITLEDIERVMRE